MRSLISHYATAKILQNLSHFSLKLSRHYKNYENNISGHFLLRFMACCFFRFRFNNKTSFTRKKCISTLWNALNKRFKILHKQRRKKCSPPYYIGKIKQNIIFYNTNYLNCTNSTILRKTSDIFYRLGSFKPSVQSLSHEKWHFQMASNDFSNS